MYTSRRLNVKHRENTILKQEAPFSSRLEQEERVKRVQKLPIPGGDEDMAGLEGIAGVEVTASV